MYQNLTVSQKHQAANLKHPKINRLRYLTTINWWPKFHGISTSFAADFQYSQINICIKYTCMQLKPALQAYDLHCVEKKTLVDWFITTYKNKISQYTSYSFPFPQRVIFTNLQLYLNIKSRSNIIYTSQLSNFTNKI